MSRHPLTWVPGDAVAGMIRRGYTILRIETCEGSIPVKAFLEDVDIYYPAFYCPPSKIDPRKAFVLLYKGGQSETHRSFSRKQP
jgi:hypothetical protein